MDFEKFTAFKSLIPLDHNYVNDCCTACGAPSPDAVFAFDSMQLVLSGELVMNFYGKVLNSSTSVNEGYVRFQIGRNGEEQIIYLKDAVRLDDGRYQFRCNINALQMADTITVSFHYGENMIGPKKTSVADYIDQVIAGTDRAETIALCQSIINYGHYAQLALQETHKFSLGTSAEDYRVTNRMNDVSIADPEELVSCKAVKTGEIPEITKITRSISLDNRTDINLYFTVTDGYVPDISVTDASGKSVAADISKTGKRYLLVIPNVAAHKLDETYTVTVDGKMTIKVSVLSYVYSVLTSDKTDAQKYAVSALYEYHKAAKAYMNAQ